jgi:hypothetical protein
MKTDETHRPMRVQYGDNWWFRRKLRVRWEYLKGWCMFSVATDEIFGNVKDQIHQHIRDNRRISTVKLLPRIHHENKRVENGLAATENVLIWWNNGTCRPLVTRKGITQTNKAVEYWCVIILSKLKNFYLHSYSCSKSRDYFIFGVDPKMCRRN